MEKYFESFKSQKLQEEMLSSQDIVKGKILDVKMDTVRLPNGKTATRELIRHIGAVCIVAVTEDDEVIVEHQYRYPFDEVVVEIPAGKLDSKDEDPADAAERELMEETGITAGDMTYMGKFYPTCGYSDEVIHMYLARNLSFGDRNLDDDEFLDVRAVPIESLVEDIMAGKIPDGKTQAAVMRAYYMIKDRK